MTIALSADERNRLMGVFSSAQEALALGRELAGGARRYAGNRLITSLFDETALRQGIRPENLEVSPDDVRNGRVLARSKADPATVQQYAQLIVEGSVAVAEATGKGLFGSGEKVSPEEKAALERIRTHLGVATATV